jgi:Flp pilus assembly protein TadD
MTKIDNMKIFITLFLFLAIAQYQEAYKKDASNLKPLYEIGKIQIRTNNFIKAQDVFQDLVERDSNNIDAKIYLGRSLLGQRKISEARKVFDQISTPHQTAKYYQGILAAYFGENDRAKNLLDEAVKIGGSEEIKQKANNFLSAYNEYKFNSESPELHLKVLLARSFNQCGEYQMAIPLLFEVTKAKLDYRDAWILLGYAYLQTEKYPSDQRKRVRWKNINTKMDTNRGRRYRKTRKESAGDAIAAFQAHHTPFPEREQKRPSRAVSIRRCRYGLSKSVTGISFVSPLCQTFSVTVSFGEY